LCGVLFCANAVPADNSVRPADSRTMERRMKISRAKRIFGREGRRPRLVLLYDGFVTSPACDVAP
jgi:hypothetical protein